MTNHSLYRSRFMSVEINWTNYGNALELMCNMLEYMLTFQTRGVMVRFQDLASGDHLL
jgi:hypothetical protein